MTLKLSHIDSHPIARNSGIDSQTPENASHFAMRITLFSPLRPTDNAVVDRTGANCRVRPKFGFAFGYGGETDLICGFGLVSATAKVQWHKFSFGRNITLKRRNCRKCKTGANCNTVASGSLAVRLLAVVGQGGAYASWYRRPET